PEFYAISCLFIQIQSHSGIDRIFHPVSPSAESVTGQAQKLSIASCHESGSSGSKFPDIRRPRKERGVIDHTVVAALAADDFTKSPERSALRNSFIRHLRRFGMRSCRSAQPDHVCGQSDGDRLQISGGVAIQKLDTFADFERVAD